MTSAAFVSTRLKRPMWWWSSTNADTRTNTATMVGLAAVVAVLGATSMPGTRALPWWAVLPLLLSATVVSMRRVTTAGLHRTGRDILIIPVGQYFFAAAILLDPIWIAALAMLSPTLRPAPRSIAVRSQRLITMMASSATFWIVFGDRHPRLDGDEAWQLLAALGIAMVVHMITESALVTYAMHATTGAAASETNIWNGYHALRDTWELSIGAVGASLALVHPALALLIVPIAILAAEHVRLERDNRQSRIDPRTDLLNVRGFNELSELERQRATQRGTTMSLLAIDLDLLRQINNVHGHRAGDAVISEIGHRLLRISRRDDVVARIGGEEFVALLPDVSEDVAVRVAERFRTAIGDTPIETPVGLLTATVSIGVSQWQPGETIETVFDRADMALYAAKESGRNRVCGASTMPSAPDVADDDCTGATVGPTDQREVALSRG
ncbi:MAG: GGDEF domain-containing protein [Ilumatobacteraceae bacterium]